LGILIGGPPLCRIDEYLDFDILPALQGRSFSRKFSNRYTYTHFRHRKLQEHTGRPIDADQKILNNIRQIDCTNAKLLVHLGDVSIGYHDKWRRELTAAATVLVRGNHDGRSIVWYLRRGWNMVVDRFDLNRMENALYSLMFRSLITGHLTSTCMVISTTRINAGGSRSQKTE